MLLDRRCGERLAFNIGGDVQRSNGEFCKASSRRRDVTGLQFLGSRASADAMGKGIRAQIVRTALLQPFRCAHLKMRNADDVLVQQGRETASHITKRF